MPSGFVWSSEGIIVTNNHVIEGASKITINFNDGRQMDAQLIGVAHSHLRNALNYTLLIPEKEVGIRRFCLIAVGLAMRTLSSILAKPDFTAGAQVKVSRQVVKKVVIATQLFAGYSRVLRRWFARLAYGLPLQALADDWGGLLPGPQSAWPRSDACGPSHAATSK